jgi:hypothetical protein
MPADPPSTASRSAPRDEHPDAPSLPPTRAGRGLHHTRTGTARAGDAPSCGWDSAAGTHRSALADRPEGHFTWMGAVPPRRRAERATHEICSGILPGGLDGLSRTIGTCSTTARPTAAGRGARGRRRCLRPAARGCPRGCDIAATQQTGGPAGALLTVGRSAPAADSLRTVVAPGATSLERAGVSWSISPAEDPAAVDALVHGASEALAAGPADLQVEVEFGALCVWVPRAVSDPPSWTRCAARPPRSPTACAPPAAVHDPLGPTRRSPRRRPRSGPGGSMPAWRSSTGRRRPRASPRPRRPTSGSSRAAPAAAAGGSPRRSSRWPSRSAVRRWPSGWPRATPTAASSPPPSRCGSWSRSSAPASRWRGSSPTTRSPRGHGPGAWRRSGAASRPRGA